MHRVVLSYSKPLLAQAVRAFWWRVVGLRFALALALVSAATFMLILGGDRSWFVGVLASVLVLGAVFVIALYVIHYRNSLHKLRAMGNPQATLEANDASFSLSSGAGSATLPWSAITEIWQFKTCWLLLLSKSQFVTLPLADLTPEATDFILARVRASGGRIG